MRFLPPVEMTESATGHFARGSVACSYPWLFQDLSVSLNFRGNPLIPGRQKENSFSWPHSSQVYVTTAERRCNPSWISLRVPGLRHTGNAQGPRKYKQRPLPSPCVYESHRDVADARFVSAADPVDRVVYTPCGGFVSTFKNDLSPVYVIDSFIGQPKLQN